MPPTAVYRGRTFHTRGAPDHERVVKTLRAWDIRIDEALFLGGKEKGPFLKAFGADIFFDDKKSMVTQPETRSQLVMCLMR